MEKKNKQNTQSSMGNKQADQADETIGFPNAELQRREKKQKEREDSLVQKEAELNKRDFHLSEKELQAKNNFPKLFENKFAAFKKQLEEREEQCRRGFETLEDEKEELRQREVAVQKAELQRDNGYADARAKLDNELFNLRKEQEKELESKRAEALKEIQKQLSEERAYGIESLEKEIADRRKAHETAIQQEKDELEQKRKVLLKDQAALDELKDELEYQKQRIQSSKDHLKERESNLNFEVDAKVVERKQSFEIEKSALNDEIARLRESVKTSSALISNFDELKHKLGDEDPAAVLLKLKTYEEEIKELRDDLATRPTQEMQEAFDRLDKEKKLFEETCRSLSNENFDLKKNTQEQSRLELKISELEAENKSYRQRFESVDADNNRLREELKRLQSSYEREQDREARIRDIETPYIHEELPRANNQVEELQWLDRINKSCIGYGLRFPRRILYAFHTALKTSEWFPITVLAGVSGTGKSELPRLYSHFGGINFLSLPVQPNWDSQESMLGFFNSIDNKFDAQPILRLLAQSQKENTEDYSFGLKNVMSLILMDEMNLAHVELYFAEFLSKLELRRGCKGDDVPSLEVKLGAGIRHYDLPLGRNVLWAGTMNQDETTKSLSDKVLDRGIIINFPRPTTLERRRQLKPLGDQAPLLSRKLWESWWCRESRFREDQILSFKSFIEDMNTSLAKVGRALGHRVWQSIEYYMSNYPDVLEAQRSKDDAGLVRAMKIAFEDQLVQKVMPKLRGIETRGKSKTDCLDKIRNQLVGKDYTIVEDFDLACEFGHGQFIWNSANYLKTDESVIGQEKEISNGRSSGESELNSRDIKSTGSAMNIPKELVELAKNKSKELWQLTIPEIKKTVNCDTKKANELKIQCKQTKESS